MKKGAKVLLDTEPFGIEPNRRLFVTGDHSNVVANPAYVLFDKDGNVLKERSAILLDEAIGVLKPNLYGFEFDLARTGKYFPSTKAAKYSTPICSGEVVPMYWADFVDELATDCQANHVRSLYAHKADFDYEAMCNTEAIVTGRMGSLWLPKGVVMNDLLVMSKVVASESGFYFAWSEQNGGTYSWNDVEMVRRSVQALGRFYYNDPNWIEAHLALEDARVEVALAIWFLKRHRRFEPHKLRRYTPRTKGNGIYEDGDGGTHWFAGLSAIRGLIQRYFYRLERSTKCTNVRLTCTVTPVSTGRASRSISRPAP